MKRRIREQSLRSELLGLNSKESNVLVLYDALSQKGFAQFLHLVEEGYAIDAFILNYMIDNGLEAKLFKVLDRCKCYYDDIYAFLKLYCGQEKAEQYFVDHKWTDLIKSEFSDTSLVEFGLWDILLERKSYDKLVANHPEYLGKAKEKDYWGVLRFLRQVKYFDEIEQLYGLNTLDNMKDAAADKYLWQKQAWQNILWWDSQRILKASSHTSLTEAYKYILEHGATPEDFYEVAKTWHFLLVEAGYFEVFVNNKNWTTLYYGGYYKCIDLDDWWENYADRDSDMIISCAVKCKNWEFLVKHAAENSRCLKRLFWRGHFGYWYRGLCQRFS